MAGVTTNQALAVSAIDRLLAAGVRTFCVCPGGRNAPLVEALEAMLAGTAEVLSFFDERSAGFFALGRARRDRSPVAVVTTSGTAAAELLPAMVEAYYSTVAVVAVTADRPRAFRGSGAPQAIDQVNLFGPYAESTIDAAHPDELRPRPAFGTPAASRRRRHVTGPSPATRPTSTTSSRQFDRRSSFSGAFSFTATGDRWSASATRWARR